ncbi:MAG: hypothetical protein ACYCVB_12570 [Bacilli bacterium]
MPAQQSFIAGIGGTARGTLLSMVSGFMFLGLMFGTTLSSWAYGNGGTTTLGIIVTLGLLAAFLSETRVSEIKRSSA